LKRRMVHTFAALLSMIALTVAGSAFAGPPTDVLKAKQTTALDLLKQSNAANQKKIDALFDQLLDYQTLTEGSLGTEWANRTDAEKAQFSDLLKQLVRNSYQRNLKKIADFNVNYLGEDAVDGGVMVNTQSKPTTPRDEPVDINFKMAAKDGTWKVQDIVTEGASLVSSYRSQFTKIIKKDGFPKVIEKMKDKLAKGDT
jgi:phospholipid transport system substrate-binding protein